MKFFTALTIVLFSLPLFSQNFSTMKQPYLSCTPTAENPPENLNFELRLENAAVGNATGITLFYYENYLWNEIFKSDILNTATIDESTYYTGHLFVVARKLKELGPSIEPVVSLDALVLVNSEAIRLKMNCTTVE